LRQVASACAIRAFKTSIDVVGRYVENLLKLNFRETAQADVGTRVLKAS
jgi:hypothetical protein